MSENSDRAVLIVEDADVCWAALEIALQSLPLVVIATGSAEEAIQILARQRVCAIVTDLHLPKMDGFEFIQHVRRQPSLAALPIVVLSGDSDPRTPDRALRTGANAFFLKPYSPAAVRQKLEQLINAN